MGKEARNEDVPLSPAAEKLFGELVKMMAASGFGEEPSLETTFADIEQYGHAVGRMMARAVDAQVVANQASAHFQEAQPCPKCGRSHPPGESGHELALTTQDGEVPLVEPAFRCTACERDFFPSTDLAEN